jgi:hypothetical protein
LGYQCIYNANRLHEDIMQRRCSYLLYKLCKKIERNLYETSSKWKTYGKWLFSNDLEIRDVLLNFLILKSRSPYGLDNGFLHFIGYLRPKELVWESIENDCLRFIVGNNDHS